LFLFYILLDIDTLAALLDEEEDVKPSTSAAVASASPESESDVLRKKLEDMEKQMQSLRDQLSHQNSSTSSNSNKSVVSTQSLKDVGLDFKDSGEPVLGKKEPKDKLKENISNSSQINEEDLESSDEDEEGNRTSNKYSEFGQFVKQRLAHQAPTTDRLKGQNCPEGWKTKSGSLVNLSKPSVKPVIKTEAVSSDNGFMDPFFGIKIINPLIGSATLQQRMEGRKQIKLSTIKAHMRGGDIKDDWVTMAVVVSKTDPRTSQKGKKYSIWKLCDLKDCTKLVSFFLFGEVFTTHWKMAIGSIIGILNPNFMKENNATDEISFTVDHHQKVLHVGSSKVFKY
jgi:minichromosome maintenance protein 10